MFDRDLIYAYCQPISNLFCGAVYCVVGQVGRTLSGQQSWTYRDKGKLLSKAAPFIQELEEEGNLDLYTKIISPDKINEVGFNFNEYAQHNLQLLVWRFAYKHKIKNVKLCLLGDYEPFDLNQIEYVDGSYLESDIVRAVAYLKRHSLIDTYYAATYRDCDLLNNYGMLTLDSLPTLQKAEYKSNFFLQPSILLNLPSLLLEAFQYVPEKPHRLDPKNVDAEKELRYLCNPESFELPPWWYLVQYHDYDDPTWDRRYNQLKERAITGVRDEVFLGWLERSSKKFDQNCIRIKRWLTYEELQPYRAGAVLGGTLQSDPEAPMDGTETGEDTVSASDEAECFVHE